jgi:DNA-binding NarL/FixJ family response regulator
VSALILIASGDETHRSGEPPSADPAARRTPGTAKVLVVEDEWFISMEIETTLEDAGYTVVGVAVNADEAVRMAEMYRPDLVLMDIRLQGGSDGIAAAAEIGRRFGPRCLFVSAHSDPDTKERGQVANPLGWLPKPFSAHQLVLAVEAALRGRR